MYATTDEIIREVREWQGAYNTTKGDKGDGMNYLFKRGKGVKRRKVHYSLFDQRTGEPSMSPLCGVALDFNTTSNVPWGLRLCKKCRERAKR